MPTYVCQCLACGNQQDYIAKVDERNNTPFCSECESPTEKVFTAAMVGAIGIADHAAVTLPGGYKTLYGRSDYLKHIKETGSRPYSDMVGEAEHQKKQRESSEKKMRKEALVTAYHKLKG